MSKRQLKNAAGQLIPFRHIHDRQTWRFLRPHTAANAYGAGYPAADILLPPWLETSIPSGGTASLWAPNSFEGYLRLVTAATVGSTAVLRCAQTYTLNGDRWVLGLHLGGVRYGGGAVNNPPNVVGATLGVAFSADSGTTQGFRIEQPSADPWATLTPYPSNVPIVLDGAGDVPGDLPSTLNLHSSFQQQLGLIFEPRSQMLYGYRLPSPDLPPSFVFAKQLSNIGRTAAIRPRVYVKAETAAAVQLQVRRVDLETWA